MLYYAITKGDNHSCQKEIKLIDRDYVKNRINDNHPVCFEDSNASAFLLLDSTLCNPTFNRIFQKVYNSICPGTTNHTLITIHSMDINNWKINFKNAK